MNEHLLPIETKVSLVNEDDLYAAFMTEDLGQFPIQSAQILTACG